MTALRTVFWGHCLDQAMAKIPYVWGGKRDDGADCSGFVTLALFKASAGTIDWRATHNTDLLWALPRISVAELQVGDLCLYWGPAPTSDADVSHVMAYAGAGQCIGQAWGGPGDTDPARSRQLGHVTKRLPVNYRSDLAGFTRLPLV